MHPWPAGLADSEEFDHERQLRVRVAGALREKYGFTVYHHDPDPGVSPKHLYHCQGARLYPDLLVYPPRHLSWAAEFPLLGVEVKIARHRGLGWLLQGIRQVERYAVGDESPWYYAANGNPCGKPYHWLIVTEHSWHYGVVYAWSNVTGAPDQFSQTADYRLGSAEATTYWFDRLLAPRASVLRGPPYRPHFYVGQRRLDLLETSR